MDLDQSYLDQHPGQNIIEDDNTDDIETPVLDNQKLTAEEIKQRARITLLWFPLFNLDRLIQSYIDG